MITAIIFSFFCLTILLGWKNALFFIKFVMRGMIVPNQEDLMKMNKIIRSKNYPPLFLIIFKFILETQSKIFLKRASKKERFISSVNLLIKSSNNYALKKDYTRNMLGKILQKYDSTFHKKLCDYTSPKATPVIDFWHGLSKINKDQKFNFDLTFKTVEDVLLVLLGNPIVNNELSPYRTDRRVIIKIQNIFGPRKEFLQNILGIAA